MLYNQSILNFNPVDLNKSTLYLGNFFQIVFLILVFCIVLFLSYYSTKVISKAKLGFMNKTNLKILETISLGMNTIHILKAGDKYFLISSSKEGIRLISELNKDEIIIENDTKQTKDNFKDYLKKFKSNQKDGGDNEN